MKKAIQIKTDGTFTELDISENSLETLQQGVEGLVQAIDLAEDLTMWCNEEGKIMSLPHNPYGQALWTMTYGNTDYIVGDIVLTGGTDSEGETLGLTPARIFYLKSVAVAISQMVEPQIVVY
jgi:hypothetical protein